MKSWWQLGEGYGYNGSTFKVYRLQCPFCYEEGNFELVFHSEKKKPNSSKKLNFDVYKCSNCVGYVHVLWSAGEYGHGSDNLYNYKVLPWVIGELKAPEHWPKNVQRFWLQAHKSIKNESWDAAAVMIRSALQLVLRDNEAKGKNLKEEIEDLATRGILPPIMKDWSEEIRFLGNISAHPDSALTEVNPEDIRDTVEFLDYLLTYLYNLPKQIEDYRKRKKAKKKKAEK